MLRMAVNLLKLSLSLPQYMTQMKGVGEYEFKREQKSD